MGSWSIVILYHESVGTVKYPQKLLIIESGSEGERENSSGRNRPDLFADSDF
jgi:hypothetical protein